MFLDLANLKVEYDDVEKSLNGYVPTSLQGISLMKNSTIKWNDIGGLKKVKKTLVETLEWPAKVSLLFAPNVKPHFLFIYYISSSVIQVMDF